MVQPKLVGVRFGWDVFWEGTSGLDVRVSKLMTLLRFLVPKHAALCGLVTYHSYLFSSCMQLPHLMPFWLLS